MYSEKIAQKKSELLHHPIYSSLKSEKQLKVFMQHHVFAVWDFMTLLKSIQRQITCVELPWRPSSYPTEMVRFVNELVLGEESDINHLGMPQDHFSLYLEAMREVGADTTLVDIFLKDADLRLLPEGIRQFVQFNLKMATQGELVEVLGAFLYGREDIIPDMFTQFLNHFYGGEERYPALHYYFARHIEVDRHEHSAKAAKILHMLTDNKSKDYLECMAYEAALEAIARRKMLWDSAYEQVLQSAALQGEQGEDEEEEE